jgi:spermidine synthase
MLEAIVFICGAVVMILEMVGSRILAPYLGSSIIVWSSLIGIILGCLSLGYWWGGRLADRNPSYRALSLIIFLAALATAAIAFSKASILDYLQHYAGSIHLSATVAVLILFAPPSTLLGMVSPYAVRLKLRDLQDAGRTVGKLYAISSVGSIFGTFLAGFFLIAFFGSTRILFILALVLIATALLASLRDRLLKISGVVLLIVAFAGVESYETYLTSLGFHDIDTRYSRIFIYPSISEQSGEPTRVMATHPKAVQSAMVLADPIALAVPYTQFYQLAAHFKPDMKSLLMLGGGGYSFPKFALAHYPEVRMEVVEIDPEVTALAKRFFALQDDPRLLVHHQDARNFLNATDKQYDVVLGDTFGSHYSIPFHLSTIEAVRRIDHVLVDDGVALVNLIAAIDGDAGRFLRAEVATFKAVFPRVYLFPVADPLDSRRWQNIMLVALKSKSEPNFLSDDPKIAQLLTHLWEGPIAEDLPPLTDDHAPVDYYTSSLKSD